MTIKVEKNNDQYIFTRREENISIPKEDILANTTIEKITSVFAHSSVLNGGKKGIRSIVDDTLSRLKTKSIKIEPPFHPSV